MEAEVRCREMLSLFAGVGEAATMADLVETTAGGRRFCAELAAADLGGGWIAATLSQFNDRVVRRIIELTAADHRLPQVPWCWLALGSEGRYEQTFRTDQDNGLMFSATDGREAEILRELFLPFAQAVNDRMADCGFAYCNGEVMAGNSRWCLSLDEWRWQFSEWVRRPDPMALMHATIFFDFRPLFGEMALAAQLRRYLLGLTRDTPAFLHLMAANALQVHPPLGFLGEVATEASDEGPTVDLKKYGARFFVDAARIFALAHGGEAVNTMERLAEAGPAAGMLAGEVAAAAAAFSHLLRLRLNRQGREMIAGRTPDHRIKPEGLHELDQLILRESLKQARRLQQRLKLNYAL